MTIKNAPKILACKVPVALHRRVEREARKVPYRTISQWMRQVIEDALPLPAVRPKAKP